MDCAGAHRGRSRAGTIACPSVMRLREVELLVVQRGIALHQDRALEDLLELLEITIAIALEHLRNVGMDAEDDIAAFNRLGDLMRLLQNLADDGLHALDVAGAFAVRARRTQRTLEALLDALAGDGDEAEIVELEDLVRRAISSHRIFKRLHHLLAIAAFVHVDEVDDDDAA